MGLLEITSFPMKRNLGYVLCFRVPQKSTSGKYYSIINIIIAAKKITNS